MKAVVKCLKGIIVTLQQLHQQSGDLLTLQDGKSVILLFAVKDILDTVVNLVFNFSTTMQPCVMFLIS